MGRDKAFLPYRGGPLVRFVATAVEAGAGSATLVGDPNIYGIPGLPTIPDLYPGEGPLGGILTALAHTAADWNLVAACDLPGLEAEFLSALVAEAERSGSGAVVPEGPSGRLEPLCGVYHRSCGPLLAAAFGRGCRKVTTALEGLRVARFRVSDFKYLKNMNTPEEWAARAE